MTSPSAVFLRLMLLTTVLLTSISVRVAAQYTLRIGVIDSPDGSMVKGARLAARQINDQGGITGADGTVFSLTVVDTPPDNMQIAIANMRQASAIAVIGPETDDLVASNIARLQELSLPIITPATGDTVLLRDNSDRIFRSRAKQSVQAGALADYLAKTAGIRSIQTVQLDMASTAVLIALANSLSAYGVRISNSPVDAANPDLDAIAQAIERSEADLVAIFGPPSLSARVYNRLRAAGFQGAVVYDHAVDPAFTDLIPADALSGIVATATWSPFQQDAASESFVLAFARAYGHLPDAIAAASYDATKAVASAVVGTGSVSENLAALSGFQAVQGELNTADLLPGELSSNVVITQLDESGMPNIMARFRGGAQLSADDQLAVTESPTPLSSPTPAPTPTPSGYTLTIQSAFQNVRSGPGLQYEVIGQLPRGTQARVLGATVDHSWLVIDFRGQWGWLASYLVDTYGNRSLLPIIQPPATPTPAPTTTPAPPRDPDLVVLTAHPPRIVLDQPMAVSVTVLNQGLTAAGPFAIAASFEPGGRYAGVNSAGLDAGQQTTVQLSGTLSGATGPQSVIIVVDLNQEVPEGAAGEANNQVYAYNYIADRQLLASGTTTIAVGSLDLDGYGNPDFSWTGTDLVALGGGGMYLMNYFTSIENVHYDAIDTSLANLKTLQIDLLRNATIGLRTADGHHGVLKPSNVTRDGTITVDYQVYR